MPLNQKNYSLSFTRLILFTLAVLVLCADCVTAQCLSSVNPVGGSGNLMILEKHSLRIISFYRHNYGNQYFEGSKRSDFNLIESANYNYLGIILGYGLAEKVSLEAEFGSFLNKTQHYNLDPSYTLQGSGFSNAIISSRFSLFKDHSKRLFVSSGIGVKIPFSTEPISRGGVELPVEVQPTIGAYGMVMQLFLVKEKPLTGIRYFITNRIEYNCMNKQDYKLGTSVFTSLFFSKHLMFSWLKGDWTTIMQLRNETRFKDKINTEWKESSGSTILYFSPQINYFIKEKWNVSIMIDLPLYQYFNGTQLATRYGISLNFIRDFRLSDHNVI